MKADSVDFLKSIVEVPSPSGFEQPVRELISNRMEVFCDEVRHDVMGNVIGVLNPGAKTRVMLAGHCDEIGMMVKNITKEGYIYFAAIGGIDPTLLAGQRVLIHNERGNAPGVIGKKAIHLMEKEELGKAPRIHDLWIDVGAKDKKAAERLVAVGDCATVDAGFLRLDRDIVAARGFDDRCGAFAVAEAMRLLAADRKKLKVAVYGVATTQEEIGLRGARTSAFGIDPHAGIAVDVGFASDYPTADKNRVGDVSIGKGPIISKGANINPVLGQMLVDAAKRKKIPYQMEGAPRGTGTDANAMQMTRAGVATALVSVPNRYMHTPVEVVSLTDLDNSAKLLAETCLRIDEKMDFIPK